MNLRLTIAQLDKIRDNATKELGDGPPLSEQIHIAPLTTSGGYGRQLDGSILVSVTRYDHPLDDDDKAITDSELVDAVTENFIVEPGGCSGFWNSRRAEIPRSALPARPRYGATH